jgi:alpha-glucoside transport system permease protein
LFSRGLSIGNVEVFSSLNASNAYSQVWIAHTIFALPLAIFLLHNFISEIPGELIEAARVDGAGHGQIFFRIVLPLTMPAIASFAIFQFLWVWNDLLVALVFADGRVAPMTKLLAEITGSRGQDWNLLTAGAFISILVPLLVFFALQRYFVRGLLAGSTKG